MSIEQAKATLLCNMSVNQYMRVLCGWPPLGTLGCRRLYELVRCSHLDLDTDL